jgi:transketolase
VTSGSLGHGFSVGVGFAMGAKLRGTDQKIYALVGDGEINEGPIWEGSLFAAHHHLDNFMVIVDENGFQAMGRTREVLELGSVQAKFESFGFETVTIDGHDEAAIDDAISCLWASDATRPKALLAKTVKGKGVPFMEHNNIWHYTRLDANTYAQALSFVVGERA